jgi:hypothetical protein
VKVGGGDVGYLGLDEGQDGRSGLARVNEIGF